jgi:hypothetical protein
MAKIAEPATPTLARLTPAGKGSLQWVARCGRCGQSLWVLEQSWYGERAELKESLTAGWVFEQQTRTWRPTERYLAQRRRARAMVSAGTAPDDEYRLLANTHGFSGRRHGKPHLPWIHSSARTDAMRLPVTIVCPECAVANTVWTPQTLNI